MNQPVTDAAAMTPEQVTEKLDAMTAAYKATQPADPRAALKERYSDATWRARLEAGIPSVVAEFNQLAAAPSDVEQRDAVTVLDHLVASGLSPEPNSVGREVHEYIHGERSTSPAERAALEAKIESWKHDAEFQKRLFSGDPEPRRLLAIAMAMKLAPVKESAA